MYTDNHIHSTCSDDGHNTMTEMALASYEKGVRKLCFTDHCDLDHYKTGVPNPDCYAFRNEMIDMFQRAKAAVPGDMELFLGLELGEGNHDVPRMREIAASKELDFVLGSLHNLKGSKDFHDMHFTDETDCLKVLDVYMEELLEIAGMECFDVVAHIGYPIRYMRRDGCNVELSMKTHGDRLRALLKTLVQNGKGLEINCAGLRNRYLNDTMPTYDILQCYKELGGEIITVGTDAHKTEHAASGLKEGFDILRDLGYKYVNVFRERKPEFIKI